MGLLARALPANGEAEAGAGRYTTTGSFPLALPVLSGVVVVAV
jgi:hypothetical protein